MEAESKQRVEEGKERVASSPAWHSLLPRKWCIFFPLQVGVLTISVAGFTLILITLIKNVFDSNSEVPSKQAAQYFLLVLYLCIMTVPFVLGFLGAFWRKRSYLKFGTFMIAMGLMLYLIFLIISLVPSRQFLIVVCPGMRCPDHHWLVPSQWREGAYSISKDPPEKPRQPKKIPDEDYETRGGDSLDYEGGANEDKGPSPGFMVYCILGTVLMTLLYICFLVWAMFTFLGFATEIKYGPRR